MTPEDVRRLERRLEAAMDEVLQKLPPRFRHDLRHDTCRWMAKAAVAVLEAVVHDDRPS